MGWTNPPTNFTKTVREDLEKTVRRIALKILRVLTSFSPVDTGRFKANWIVGVGRREARTLSNKDKAGMTTFNKGKKKLAKTLLGKTVFISNNLPYAKRLNEGHSEQVPLNFVQQAIKRSLR